MTEEQEDPSYKATCLCFPTRACLLVWSGSGIVFCLAVLYFQVSSDDYFGGVSKVILYITTITDMSIFIFGLISTLLKRRRWLIIEFWCGIFMIIIFFLNFCLNALFIFDIIGNSPKYSTSQLALNLTEVAFMEGFPILLTILHCQAVYYYTKELKEGVEEMEHVNGSELFIMLMEEEEQKVYRANCLCFTTRTCLLFWTVFGIISCLALLFIQVYFDDSYISGMSKLLSYIVTGLDLFAFHFALVSILLKRRRWLIIGFWCGIFIIIYFGVSIVVDSLFILGVLGDFPLDTSKEKILFVVITVVSDVNFILIEALFCQGLYYYTKELKENQREVHYHAYLDAPNPGKYYDVFPDDDVYYMADTVIFHLLSKKKAKLMSTRRGMEMDIITDTSFLRNQTRLDTTLVLMLLDFPARANILRECQ